MEIICSLDNSLNPFSRNVSIYKDAIPLLLSHRFIGASRDCNLMYFQDNKQAILIWFVTAFIYVEGSLSFQSNKLNANFYYTLLGFIIDIKQWSSTANKKIPTGLDQFLILVKG